MVGQMFGKKPHQRPPDSSRVDYESLQTVDAAQALNGSMHVERPHPVASRPRPQRPACAARRARQRRRGTAVVMLCSIMAVLAGFLSFAVDYGRVQLVKAELQRAADAAARYAATGLSNSSWQSRAIAAAADNTVDGTSLVLQPGDITRVNVASDGTYTTTPPFNGVRVIAERSAARGTAVQLILTRLIGRATCDVRALSIAVVSNPGWDIVATNSITLSGSARIRRIGTESGTVRVATNGSCSVPAGTFIYGDVYHRATLPSEPANGITGTLYALPSDISFPAATVPSGAIPLGPVTVPGGTYTVPGGTYVCSSINISGGAVINITGDAAIYCNGPVNLTNCTINTNGTVNKITFYVTTSDTITYNMTNPFHVLLYAPNSTLNLNGASPLVGSCVVRRLNMSGTSTFSYSSALPLPTSGGTTVQTAK